MALLSTSRLLEMHYPSDTCNWPIENKPSFCSCGHTFSIDHALSCPTGGFPSIRHNEVRDITASLLSEVCHNVSIEPHLQPLSGSAKTECNSRLDVAANGFGGGGRFERALFDVRVFNPCAQSNRQATLQATYRRHEQEKKREYDQRVREIEHSTFSYSPSTISFGRNGKIGYYLLQKISRNNLRKERHVLQ